MSMGDAWLDEEWVGRGGMFKKKKKGSVFTATFMAQFRFVSVGFVSRPLRGVWQVGMYWWS